MHTFDSKFRYMITITIVAQNDPIITRLGFRAGALCSHHVLNLHHPLDFNFNNPNKTADFFFFDDREDARKTDNNVVKGKGCLIHVHEDINNLPPFPS